MLCQHFLSIFITLTSQEHHLLTNYQQFAQQHVQTSNKETIRSLQFSSFERRIHQWEITRWIPLTKGQLCSMCLHAIISSCCCPLPWALFLGNRIVSVPRWRVTTLMRKPLISCMPSHIKVDPNIDLMGQKVRSK